MFYFIRVNREKIYLDRKALRQGELKLDDRTGSLGEQCEDCGTDIFEGCSPNRGSRVRCKCGIIYPVQEES